MALVVAALLIWSGTAVETAGTTQSGATIAWNILAGIFHPDTDLLFNFTTQGVPYLLLETICATGIRVSEVKYITVEAVRDGRAEVSLKGKIRTILLPGKLCRKLQKYAGKQKIASGEIFLTRSGRGITRRQIWAEMKALCRQAGVAASKPSFLQC